MIRLQLEPGSVDETGVGVGGRAVSGGSPFEGGKDDVRPVPDEHGFPVHSDDENIVAVAHEPIGAVLRDNHLALVIDDIIIRLDEVTDAKGFRSFLGVDDRNIDLRGVDRPRRAVISIQDRFVPILAQKLVDDAGVVWSIGNVLLVLLQVVENAHQGRLAGLLFAVDRIVVSPGADRTDEQGDHRDFKSEAQVPRGTRWSGWHFNPERSSYCASAAVSASSAGTPRRSGP